MLGLLDDVRVVELSHRLAGSFCAKLLADQGAETLKIEPPGRGDSSRYEPPFLGDRPNADNSSLFPAFNTNKRGILLDVASPSGRALLERLLADQDILIESFQPGEMSAMGLSYEALREINPRLIVVSITPFGQTGPYRDFQGTDLIAQAMGGFIFTTGQSDRPPMGTALEQTKIVAARNGAIAIMASLLRQRESGQGQHIGPRSWHRPPVGARRAVPFLLGHVRPPEEGTARRAPTSKRLASQIEHLADRVIKTAY